MLVEADYANLADPVGFSVNVAADAAGAVATASSEDAAGGNGPAFVIDGNVTSPYWMSSAANTLPQWVRVDFATVYMIDRVTVYSLQDGAPVAPTDVLTGSLYALTTFDVQVWTGWDWITVASVAGNTLIKRRVTFPAYRTSAVRVVVGATPDGKARLTEIEARTPASVTGTEYMATHPYISGPSDTDPNRIYRAIVKALPSFTQKMNDVLIGRSTANLGTIQIAGSELTDSWLLDRTWIGRRVRLALGDADWSRDDFRAVWSGVIGDVRVQDTTTIIIEARDLQHLLSQPLNVGAVPTGPLASNPMPVAIGTFYNAPAILVDDATHKYAVHDGNVSTITAVRDRGVSVAFTDLGDGTFTVAALPNGRITVDGTGAIGTDGTALKRAADIIRYLAVDVGPLTDDDLDIDSFVTLNAVCPQTLGYYSNAVGTNSIDAIDLVCATVGAFSAVTRDGKFYVKRFDFDGYPVMTLADDRDIVLGGLRLDKVLPPVRDIRIAGCRNFSPSTYTVGGSGSGVSETQTNTYSNSHKFWCRAKNASATQAAVPMPRVLYRRSGGGAPVVSNTTSDDGAYQSLFVDQADAQMEAQRRMRLWGFQRYLFSVACNVRPMALKLGDVVTLQHRRYGLSAGRNGVVVGIDERFGQRQATLSVLV